jgi:perosamine synthetase
MRGPVPAVAMPLGWRDIWAARKAGPGTRERFERACREYHGSEAAFAVSSGRLALWLALTALKAVCPDRNQVLLPAYTCPTVGRAVLAADLSGLCVDVSPNHFNIDADRMSAARGEDVLAVVAPHMFGTPCDMRALLDVCRAHGASLIEDVAQACGARFEGRVVGGLGDLSFLSLGRSKNLRGAKGGVLLVNRPGLVEAVRSAWARLHDAGSAPSDVLRPLAISALSQPAAWNLTKRLPWLNIGAEDQHFDDRPARLTNWQGALGLAALARLDGCNAARTRVGQAIAQALDCCPDLRLQGKPEGAEGVYVRLAGRLGTDAARRDAVVRRLQRRGIDARAFYTRPIYDYDWWQPANGQRPCPVAETLVATNLVLPIHYAMAEADADRIASAVKGALGR